VGHTVPPLFQDVSPTRIDNTDVKSGGTDRRDKDFSSDNKTHRVSHPSHSKDG
jgi:hypothetical protein